MKLTDEMNTALSDFHVWLVNGARDEASWRGLGAAYQRSGDLWGVPLSVEVHYTDGGGVWCMVCGASRFGAWEVDGSSSAEQAEGDLFEAVGYAFTRCVVHLWGHRGFRLTLVAAMAEAEAAAIASSVGNAETNGEGPRRL